MERACLQEHKSLVSEITKGMEQVKQLKASSSGNQERLLERMLASYEEALSILTGAAPHGQCQSVIPSSSDRPGSSSSVRKITQSQDPTIKGSEKRKLFSSITTEVTVLSDSLSEVPDDGYIWRKYGQKEILGFSFPRSYYRCTNQRCTAKKSVQRSEDNPLILNIRYGGKHKCLKVEPAVPKTAQEKQSDLSLVEESVNATMSSQTL